LSLGFSAGFCGVCCAFVEEKIMETRTQETASAREKLAELRWSGKMASEAV